MSGESYAGRRIDHLISLELGGANTVDNLWPQPYDGEWNALADAACASHGGGSKRFGLLTTLQFGAQILQMFRDFQMNRGRGGLLLLAHK
jgi:hypothetical protein